MYKMATAGVPRGTILAVHLQKCSYLSIFFLHRVSSPQENNFPLRLTNLDVSLHRGLQLFYYIFANVL
jgi:hypothetical protein